jgi:hypothetical protein
MPLNVPVRQNQKLASVVKRIDESVKLNAYWYCSNVNAINRMSINDHGPVHIRIVSNMALKLLRMLLESGISSSVERDHQMTKDDAEVIVVLAACLHDIGHIVHRLHHEPFSVSLAADLLPELLNGTYAGREQAILTAEVLHAIYAHETEVAPLTIEAGVVKVADALDMEEGRARIPFKAGTATIHAVSALAISEVRLKPGEKKPICIEIEMTNSAGIFQLDNLLKPKLRNSGIKEFFEIRAAIVGDGTTEKKIIDRYEI